MFQSSKLNRMALWYKPWFYKHVETFLFGKDGFPLTEKVRKIDHLLIPLYIQWKPLNRITLVQTYSDPIYQMITKSK
jgi:hypothetical protein